MRSQIDVDIARNEAVSETLVERAFQEIRIEKLTLFDKFWSAVSTDGKGVDAALFQKLKLDETTNCFEPSGTRDAYRRCFMSNELNQTEREILSNLGENK